MSCHVLHEASKIWKKHVQNHRKCNKHKFQCLTLNMEFILLVRQDFVIFFTHALHSWKYQKFWNKLHFQHQIIEYSQGIFVVFVLYPIKTWIPHQRKLVKIGQMVGNVRFLIVINVFLLFSYICFEKSLALHLKNIESPAFVSS